MTCDRQALSIKAFSGFWPRRKSSSYSLKIITNHLLILHPWLPRSYLQAWKPMLCHDFLLGTSGSAFPSVFLVSPETSLPLAFPGLSSLMTAALGPWNYRLMHPLSAWLGAQWYYWTFPCLSIVHSLFLSQWSEDVCAAHLTQRDGFQATTQGQLKEQLYQEIIHYFDKGKVRHTLSLDLLPVLPTALEAQFLIHDVCRTRIVLHIVYRSIVCMFLQLVLMRNLFIYIKKSIVLLDPLWIVRPQDIRHFQSS